MTRRVGWVALVLGLLVAAPVSRAWGHGGHAVVPQEEAVAKGRELVGLLIGRGKIPGTWSEARLEKAALVLVDGLEEWHLVFANEAPPEEDRRRLYVFLNYDGQVLAANFTGDSR